MVQSAERPRFAAVFAFGAPVTALLIAVVTPAQAQSPFFVPVHTAVAYDGQVVICGDPGLTMGAGMSAVSCNGPGVSYSAVGRTLLGSVGAASTVSVSGSRSPDGTGTWSAIGTGGWGDRLTFTGRVIPAMARMQVRWDGSVGSTAVSDDRQLVVDASAKWAFNAINLNAGESLSYVGTADAFSYSRPRDGPGSAFMRIDTVQSFVVPVARSSPFFDFFYSVAASSGIALADAGPGGAWSATSSVDFSNTGRLTGLAFFDDAGNDITAEVSYSFANGTEISPTDVAPEPATWALLSTGLLAVGAIARRRRTTAA